MRCQSNLFIYEISHLISRLAFSCEGTAKCCLFPNHYRIQVNTMHRDTSHNQVFCTAEEQNRIGSPCSFEHTRKILGLLLRCPDSMFFSTVFRKAENLPRMNKNANVSLTRVGRQNDWITFILTARKLILYLLP